MVVFCYRQVNTEKPYKILCRFFTFRNTLIAFSAFFKHYGIVLIFLQIVIDNCIPEDPGRRLIFCRLFHSVNLSNYFLFATSVVKTFKKSSVIIFILRNYWGFIFGVPRRENCGIASGLCIFMEFLALSHLRELRKRFLLLLLRFHVVCTSHVA